MFILDLNIMFKTMNIPFKHTDQHILFMYLKKYDETKYVFYHYL